MITRVEEYPNGDISFCTSKKCWTLSPQEVMATVMDPMFNRDNNLRIQYMIKRAILLSISQEVEFEEVFPTLKSLRK